MSAVVIDTETTGLSPHADRIVEIAVVDFDTGQTLLHTLLDPEMIIPENVVASHGITNARVVGAPKFADVAAQLAELIFSAAAWIGQNPWFDRGMIAGEYRRLSDAGRTNIRWPPMICTKRMWDIHEPREARKLQNAYKRFVSKEGFDGAHGALADTRAALAVFRAQRLEFDLSEKRWDELDPDQKRWVGPSNHILLIDGVLTMGFGKHEKKPCHEVDSGYWRWLCGSDFPEHLKTIGDFITLVKKGRATAEELRVFCEGRFL